MEGVRSDSSSTRGMVVLVWAQRAMCGFSLDGGHLTGEGKRGGGRGVLLLRLEREVREKRQFAKGKSCAELISEYCLRGCCTADVKQRR